MQNLYTENDTIFVQIASYRDPELQPTLQDLFQKAKRPENIFVGICHQYDIKGGEDQHLFKNSFPRPKQLRIDEVDYRESAGVCWARNRVQKLYLGEKWIMQIDSHMRLRENWDEIIINDIKKINGGKNIVFTNVASSYDQKTNNITLNEISSAVGISFFDNPFRVHAKTNNFNPIYKTRPGTFFSANFLFGDAEIISKNKINPNLALYDEIPMALKYFCAGGRTYSYEKSIVCHLWADQDENKVARSNTYKYTSLADETCMHLYGAKKSNGKAVLKEVKEFNLGKERTLRDYERFSGVSFKGKKIREYTKNSALEEWQEVAKIKVVKSILGQVKSKSKIKIAIYNPSSAHISETVLDHSFESLKSVKDFYTEIKSFSSPQEIKNFNPDFILSWFPVAKFGNIPTYVMFNAQELWFKDRDGNFVKEFTTPDGYITQSEKTAKIILDLYRTFGKEPNIFTGFSLARPKTEFDDRINNQPKLAYFSANWEKRGGNEPRFKELIDYLTDECKVDFLELYGNEMGWSWVKNQDYVKGSIPFSDDAIFEVYRAAGVGLAINSHEYYYQGITTARTQEVIASGAICITDDMPFQKQMFGESLLYITSRDEKEMARQIINHFNWIKDHPKEAKEKAKQAHKILSEHLSLEVVMEKVINFHHQTQSKKNNISKTKIIFGAKNE